MQAAKTYVLIVDPNGEQKAVNRLLARGHEAYTPRLWRRQRAARGRVIDVRRAMFPCYAFITAQSVDWRAVEATPGVWRFMRGREFEPLELPGAALDAIVAKEADLEQRWAAQRRITSTVGLTVGQRVTARVGPWADMLGQIERFDEKGRAVVLLEILGAVRGVPVERAELVAA